MKKPFVQRKKIVLFIDTGDNCRAPMAKGYLEKLLKQRGLKQIVVSTCGVMTPHGLLPVQEAVQMLTDEGEDIRHHRSKPMTDTMLQNADLILGMTPYHVQKAIRKVEEARPKTFLLKEYVGFSGRNIHIPDPMGGTMEIFKKVFSEIKQSLNLLIEKEFFKPGPGDVAALPEPKPAKAAKGAKGEAKPKAEPKPKAPKGDIKSKSKAEPKQAPVAVAVADSPDSEPVVAVASPDPQVETEAVHEAVEAKPAESVAAAPVAEPVEAAKAPEKAKKPDAKPAAKASKTGTKPAAKVAPKTKPATKAAAKDKKAK